MKMIKWSVPVFAFAALFALTTARGDDAKPSSEKIKVSGTVLQEDGKPAENARVRLMPPSMKKSDTAAEKPANQAADEKPGDAKPSEGTEKPGRATPIAETMSDKDGKFSLEAPAGKYRLMASIRNVGNASKNIELKVGKDLDNVELKLKPSARKTPTEEKPATPAAPAK